MQSQFYGYTAKYKLQMGPITGTVAECAAKCAAVGNCVAFSWEIKVAPTAKGECHLKTGLPPRVELNFGDVWTTYIVRCPGMHCQRICH